MNQNLSGDFAWALAIAGGVIMVIVQLAYEYKESPKRKHKR
jgi:hypothetical protein